MQDTICAISTPVAVGGVAVVRISGEQSLSIVNKIFSSKFKVDTIQPRHAYYGEIIDGDITLDQVVVTYYAAPKSFTGEDVVEISCHGSLYVQKRLLELLVEQGCRMAIAGEFTQRAFLNGKIDLSQAESVADLIAAQSRMSHQLAMQGLKGGVSDVIKSLRERLLYFSSMLELELDFAEEDVEFADRQQFADLLEEIDLKINQLLNSFAQGNAIKNGIPVAIVGKPNVGKSTLLNVLLRYDRAIISDIPGTTRDTIEDTFTLGGYTFRLIDTAGLRTTNDNVEQLGINRTYQSIKEADIILYVIDVASIDNYQKDLDECLKDIDMSHKQILVLANKTDLYQQSVNKQENVFFISAKCQQGIDAVEQKLEQIAQSYSKDEGILLSNLRHYQALQNADLALQQAKETFSAGLSNDLIAVSIREVLYHLGTIIGEVSNEEILGNIFSRFCIGK
ncbi:MAG: tRNA uridine-5-carboxymethylaminomethyl(34) synthesis GTPase MnmE [Bacteroidales bacterium]|jgi:tRNA modification GTPase|nr:tRNA uridine-5-carboxymethylaminomethyl(34) synthesis GTPase MnmE [Bacteroidales bacterium]